MSRTRRILDSLFDATESSSLALESISLESLTEHSERLIASIYANDVVVNSASRLLATQSYYNDAYRDESRHVAQISLESICKSFEGLGLSATMEGITTDIYKVLKVRITINQGDAEDLKSLVTEGRSALIKVENNLAVIRQNLGLLNPSVISSMVVLPETLGLAVFPQHKNLIDPYLDTLSNQSVIRHLDVNLEFTESIMDRLLDIGVVDTSKLSTLFDYIAQQIEQVNSINLDGATLLSSTDVFTYLPDSFDANQIYYLKKHQTDPTVYGFDVLMKSDNPYIAHQDIYTDVMGVMTSGTLDALEHAEILRYCDALAAVISNTHQMLNRLMRSISLCTKDSLVLDVVAASIDGSKTISLVGRERINEIVMSLSKNKDCTIGMIVEHCRHSIYGCVGMMHYLIACTKNLTAQEGATIQW